MQSSHWQPTASLSVLRERAEIIKKIRAFFLKRHVLEIDTPLLSHATVTDLHIQSISTTYEERGSSEEKMMFLQTSPEYAMKRLLAAGIGPIYQICKAFRQGEVGKIHNPEFTMLEWYRPEFNHHDLMGEMEELLRTILAINSVDKISISEVYKKFLNVDPHRANIAELKLCAEKFQIQLADPSHELEVNFWLDLLFSHCIEPHLGHDCPVFLYDFPVSQAALAQIRDGDPRVASRFEVYFKGIELANGFHELQDSVEQRKRFSSELEYRKQKNLKAVPLDERFLSALEKGLPDCSGVAVGLDRLILLALGYENISDVMSFSFMNA